MFLTPLVNLELLTKRFKKKKKKPWSICNDLNFGVIFSPKTSSVAADGWADGYSQERVWYFLGSRASALVRPWGSHFQKEVGCGS